MPVRLLLLSLLLGFSACNVTKHLQPGQTLYDGAKLKIETPEKGSTKNLKTELKALVRPKPNKSILGVRYKLYFYYLAGEPKGKGLRYWVRNKLGEPPVLASDMNVEKNRKILENHLQNKGYFQATVAADTVQKMKFTTAVFDAATGPQYTIRNVYYPIDSSDISKKIQQISKHSRLKPGKPYDLDVIKAERDRIDNRLKNQGYYYYNPDYILNKVDSTVGKHQVDMYLGIKKGTPINDLQVYRINNIWVYPNYTLAKDSMLGAAPAIPYQDYYIIDPDHKFRLNTFKKMLVFHKGDKYSRREHNQSLSRLMNMGTFKFVKARFEEVDTNGNYLDPYYFMTPLPRQSYKAEVTGLTKSNNATGTEVSIGWTNRNAFRGAEQFSINAFGGLETQVYGGQSDNTARLGLETNLYFPRIIGPFGFASKSDFVPKTRFNLRYEYYDRTDQYTLNSYTGSFGYVWKTNIKIEHQLNILNLNYVHPQRIAPSFQVALDTDITLRRSIEPQFILGPSYNYNYSSNNQPNNKKDNFYFNANVDVPGNLLGVFAGTQFNKEKRGQGKFFNTIFAQYARVELDGRYYRRVGDIKHKNNILASRLLLGVGVPYGNSDALPFIKSFFIGGVNDLRAFRARTLGPGTYYAPNEIKASYIPDQPGDMKLLASSELRAKLVSIINGAVFVDAGNIWTLKADPSRPGSQFSSEFLNQIAVGAGLGLRLDLSFLIVRVDLATPIRKPFSTTEKMFD
ncbi:MAG: BamA/TamA family outer membrane protein, partial [Chitinophagaceae bacterium]